VRVLQREVLDRQWFSSLDEAEVALGRFVDYYNFHRPSGTRGWQTPAERYMGAAFTDRGFGTFRPANISSLDSRRLWLPLPDARCGRELHPAGRPGGRPETLGGDNAPDRVDQTEWPSAREKAIDAGEQTGGGERHDEPAASSLEREHDHHAAERYHAIEGDENSRLNFGGDLGPPHGTRSNAVSVVRPAHRSPRIPTPTASPTLITRKPVRTLLT
jgi:hypothetical protein